jgi:hypothetical protein
MTSLARTAIVLVLVLLGAGCVGPVAMQENEAIELAADKAALASGSGEGCVVFEGVDSPAGTAEPVTPRSGWPIRRPLASLSSWPAADAPTDFAALDVPPSVEDLALQATLSTGVGADQSVISVYAATPLTSTETIVDLLSRGGVTVLQRQAAGQDASLVVETVGSRAATVRIGPYVGALVHADPLPTGARSWNLYWSDGARDLSIEGGVSSGTVVALARSFYCNAP